MRSRPATSRSISGPPKRKRHRSGFLRISSHGPTPGSGASIRTKRATRSWILRREGVADHVADIVRNEIGALNAECIQHAGDIPALGLLVVTALGTRGEPHSPQVGRHYRMIAGEFRR